MDIEFHYTITYIIALYAGCSAQKSAIIAYSSQYVDDNDGWEKVYVGDRLYLGCVTNANKFISSKNLLDSVLQTFHFIPGNASKGSPRMDSEKHELCVTPNSDNALALFRMAIDQANPYLLGIACHAFADTWAHQNFIGTYDDFNSKQGIVGRLIPSIGHADFLDDPDVTDMIWYDTRLVQALISNPARILEAAESMYDSLVEYFECCKKLSGKRKLMDGLKKCLKLKQSERYAAYENLALYLGAAIPQYQKQRWKKKAISHVRASYYKCNNLETFYDTSWYKFQEAAKFYKNQFNMCVKIFGGSS